MKKILSRIVDDTLKQPDANGVRRYSRTSLTMATAWLAVMITHLYDFFTYGFRWESFTLMVTVALGVKLVDSKSKQIEKS